LEATLLRLQQTAELRKEADFSTPETIKSALWDYAEQEGRGEGLWPLRVALTGRERSPDPFTVAHIIGYEDTIRRLKSACDKIGQCVSPFDHLSLFSPSSWAFYCCPSYFWALVGLQPKAKLIV